MNEKTIKRIKRPAWHKVVGLMVAMVATVAIVIGVYSTAIWAGTDYDYQGNEVAQALPVTKSATGGNNSDAQANTTKSSTASVIIDGTNVANNSKEDAKLDDLNYPQTGSDAPGAVQVVGTTAYPQTGDSMNYGAIILGVGLLLGLAFSYRGSNRRVRH